MKALYSLADSLAQGSASLAAPSIDRHWQHYISSLEDRTSHHSIRGAQWQVRYKHRELVGRTIGLDLNSCSSIIIYHDLQENINTPKTRVTWVNFNRLCRIKNTDDDQSRTAETTCASKSGYPISTYARICLPYRIVNQINLSTSSIPNATTRNATHTRIQTGPTCPQYYWPQRHRWFRSRVCITPMLARAKVTGKP